MKKRSKWAKRCSECGKVLRSHNKSLLCFFHRIQKYNKEYRKRPYVKIKKKEYDREYTKKNKERLSKYYKEYYQSNKKRREEYYKEYYQKNKDKIKKYRKEYMQRPEVKERVKEYNKKYYQKARITDFVTTLK